ncbi:MAG: SDR family NAD(P)-dependent oxidoreductase [Acidobacteriota bacterium]|nr:SDR family NAD(P)-dependent oxidoreductase [Acidobacteriota bacterium]
MQERAEHTLLAGHVAVVTGASIGIGRAIATMLAREDACVCLVGRNRDSQGEATAAARSFSQATSFSFLSS